MVPMADAPYVQVILVRDKSSGRVHRRAKIAGNPALLAYEGDNADSSGEFEIIPDITSVSDDSLFCRRCFGAVDPPKE